MYRPVIVLVLLILITALMSGCTTSPVPQSPASSPTLQERGTPAVDPVTNVPGSFSLQVDSLASGATLPDRYTCRGAGESPGISWEGIPAGTKGLVLILEDPDAPSGTFTHWILYNIPPEKGSLAPAQSNAKVLVNGAQQGETTAGSRGYYPPCPPIGTTHRYIFRLYAVDMDIAMPAADRESIDAALAGHTITRAAVSTEFSR